jgi:hypothetical protein
VRLIGGVLTEGRIDTFPLSGSTILELAARFDAWL